MLVNTGYKSSFFRLVFLEIGAESSRLTGDARLKQHLSELIGINHTSSEYINRRRMLSTLLGLMQGASRCYTTLHLHTSRLNGKYIYPRLKVNFS